MALSDQKMDGLCVVCAGKGEVLSSFGSDSFIACTKCNGTGTVEFTIAVGEAYTRECTTCGWTNGMMITPPGPKVEDGAKVDDWSGGTCLSCRTKTMIWKHLGRTDEDL